MRDLYQVLHEKQMEVLRLRKETAALRLVLSMIEDEEEAQADSNSDPRIYHPGQTGFHES